MGRIRERKLRESFNTAAAAPAALSKEFKYLEVGVLESTTESTLTSLTHSQPKDSSPPRGRYIQNKSSFV